MSLSIWRLTKTWFKNFNGYHSVQFNSKQGHYNRKETNVTGWIMQINGRKDVIFLFLFDKNEEQMENPSTVPSFTSSLFSIMHTKMTELNSYAQVPSVSSIHKTYPLLFNHINNRKTFTMYNQSTSIERFIKCLSYDILWRNVTWMQSNGVQTSFMESELLELE